MNIPFSFINIEGNIGSGKSSLSKKIAADFDANLILEEFENNPFLPKFYEDPEKNAFPLELSFMAERFQQLIGKGSNLNLFSKIKIADYSFFKSKLFAQNNLKEDEYNLFNKLYNIMFSSIKHPELLIYLHSNIERLQKNIQLRGREYEQNIDNEYLKNIEQKYFDYLKKQDNFPVLIIDVSNIDFVKDKKHYQKIISEIQHFDIKQKAKKLILS